MAPIAATRYTLPLLEPRTTHRVPCTTHYLYWLLLTADYSLLFLLLYWLLYLLLYLLFTKVHLLFVALDGQSTDNVVLLWDYGFDPPPAAPPPPLLPPPGEPPPPPGTPPPDPNATTNASNTSNGTNATNATNAINATEEDVAAAAAAAAAAAVEVAAAAAAAAAAAEVAAALAALEEEARRPCHYGTCRRFAYYREPVVLEVNPDGGPQRGGGLVTARGGHFDGMSLNVTIARCAFGSHAVRHHVTCLSPPTMSHCALRLRLARGAPARDAAPCYLLITRTMLLLPGCDRTALPGYHPFQVRVLEMPDKGRLLCATPPLRMSRQPFRLALNGRDFVRRANLEPALLTTLLLTTYYLLLTAHH